LLGPLVASAGFHEPTMLAKQAATVDAVSSGRLILGLGSGWNEREYRAFGFPFDHRVSRFAEAFTIIRSLLADGAIDFAGEYYTVENCVLHPRAARPGGPPLMVGSTRPRMLSITLPYVDSWNVWWSDYGNTPEGFAALQATIPPHLERSACVLVQMPGEAVEREPTSPPVSPDELVDHLRALGADEAILVCSPITEKTIRALGDGLRDLLL